MAKVTIVLRIKEGTRYPFKTAVWVGNRLKQQFCLGERHSRASRGRLLLFKLHGAREKKFAPATADAVDAIAFRDRRQPS
jgi:hypothetical protein